MSLDTLNKPSFPLQESVANTEFSNETAEDFSDVLYEISNNELLNEILESERAEAIQSTFELYVAAREIVAPVITGFAHDLLMHADGKQIVFAGRDGIGAYIAASILKKKFEYPASGPNQLIYAYLTRRIVDNTPTDILQHYLSQEGLTSSTDKVILADIGMYGTIVPKIQRTLPNIETRYLISKNSQIPGYADSEDHPMSALVSVMGNPGVHFMEDTFSGNIPSPSELSYSDGKLVPNTIDQEYPPAELLKRLYALKAIEDYTMSALEPPNNKNEQAIANLNEFLSDESRFAHMMVPHARSF